MLEKLIYSKRPPLRSVLINSRIHTIPKVIDSSPSSTNSTVSSKTKKSKVVRCMFFINGDKYFNGIHYVINTNRLRTLDSLCNELSRILIELKTLPSGVRWIFNCEDGSKVHSIREFIQNGNYVCSSTEHFIRMDYQALSQPRQPIDTTNYSLSFNINNDMTNNNLNNSNNQKLYSGIPKTRLPLVKCHKNIGHNNKYKHNNQMKDSSSQQTLSTPTTISPSCLYTLRPKLVALLRGSCRAAPSMRPSRRVFRFLFNHRTAQNYEQVMNEISKSVKLNVGAVYCVYGLSTSKKITCLSDFFDDELVYLVYGRTEKCNLNDFLLDENEQREITSIVGGSYLNLFYNSPKSPIKNRKMVHYCDNINNANNDAANCENRLKIYNDDNDSASMAHYEQPKPYVHINMEDFLDVIFFSLPRNFPSQFAAYECPGPISIVDDDDNNENILDESNKNKFIETINEDDKKQPNIDKNDPNYLIKTFSSPKKNSSLSEDSFSLISSLNNLPQEPRQPNLRANKKNYFCYFTDSDSSLVKNDNSLSSYSIISTKSSNHKCDHSSSRNIKYRNNTTGNAFINCSDEFSFTSMVNKETRSHINSFVKYNETFILTNSTKNDYHLSPYGNDQNNSIFKELSNMMINTNQMNRNSFSSLIRVTKKSFVLSINNEKQSQNSVRITFEDKKSKFTLCANTNSQNSDKKYPNNEELLKIEQFEKNVTKLIKIPISPKYRVKREVDDAYILNKSIGKGKFGVVYTCIHRATEQTFAMKIIDKDVIKEESADKSQSDSDSNSEVAILKQLRNHPNIVCLYDHFEFVDQNYIILELLQNGDLFDAIKEDIRYPESESATMINDVFNGVQYLHKLNIIHRDIKLENLLVSYVPIDENSNNSSTSLSDIKGCEQKFRRVIKISDFGLATQIEPGDVLYNICGTPSYVAPEIILEIGYTFPVDIWASGVVLYILLSGVVPFGADESRESKLFDQILSGKFEMEGELWKDVSATAKTLIRSMLCIDQTRRIKIKDLVNHPWILNFNKRNIQ